MFGIGMPELMLIFVLALLVFGPKELPKIARTVGKAMAELRRASDELRDGIQREIDVATQEEATPAPPSAAENSPPLAEPTASAEHQPAGQTPPGEPMDASGLPAEPPETVARAETSEGQDGPTGTEEPTTTTVASAPVETIQGSSPTEEVEEPAPQTPIATHATAQPAEIRNA